MSKLSAIRDIMRAKNIPTLALESDQVAAARRIVGRANAAQPYLSNMIRALQLMPWENTAADWQRLEAAVIVRAYSGARRAI